ncbi:MAG TPA: Gldg family protein [Treponemataceae bacterium]|nr:Gldg family protein [Treponemataceae bacterium]
MKKFTTWLKSNKNNTILVIIFLVLLNLVCANTFFRLDLTHAKSYSLSESSKTLVSTLEQPLSVKVFFTANLPAPYNATQQYLKDLLVEYKGNANGNFDYDFYNMDHPENQSVAAEYNLRQVQIQQVTDTEVGLKQAYMGLVLMYADRIEAVDGLTSSEGMEYKLTTAMSKMIADTSALAGLSSNVSMTLYITPKIAEFGVSGFDTVDTAVVDALSAVNSVSGNRITFTRVVPAEEEIDSIVGTYGLPTVNWSNEDGSTGTGTLGVVLEYEEAFRIVPLSITRGLFGYGVTGLDNLETSIGETLHALVSKQVDVAYLTGVGEKGLADTQSGAYNFKSICSDWYNVIGVDLSEDEIPTGVKALIINGPTIEMSEDVLYKIDQFVMKGGNLLVFADPFIEEQDPQYAMYGAPPSYEPNESNISRLLEKYGVSVSQSYILDEQCHTQNDRQYGSLNFYYIPWVQQKTMNQDSVITANIPYTLLLQTAAVTPNFKNTSERSAEILLSSSHNAWHLNENIELHPMKIFKPAQTNMNQESLAVLLRGRFSSAFDAVPVGADEYDENTSSINAQSRLASSVQPSEIIVCGSSLITTSALIDENGQSATAIFLRNAVDYLNGNADLCSMRTKGIASSTFVVDNPTKASLAKLLNQYGLPFLVVLIGFVIWRIRELRRRKIQAGYYPDAMKDRLGEKGKKDE